MRSVSKSYSTTIVSGAAVCRCIKAASGVLGAASIRVGTPLAALKLTGTPFEDTVVNLLAKEPPFQGEPILFLIRLPTASILIIWSSALLLDYTQKAEARGFCPDPEIQAFRPWLTQSLLYSSYSLGQRVAPESGTYFRSR